MLSAAAFILQQQSWNLTTDCMAHKAENIYYVALYSKSLPTPGRSQAGYFLLSKTVVKYTMFSLPATQYVQCSSFSVFLPKPSNRLAILHLRPLLLLRQSILHRKLRIQSSYSTQRQQEAPLLFYAWTGKILLYLKSFKQKKKCSGLWIIWKISHHFFQALDSMTIFYVSFINTTAPSYSSWDSKWLPLPVIYHLTILYTPYISFLGLP